MEQNNYGGPEHGVLQWLPPKHAGTSYGAFNHKQLGSGVDEAPPCGMKAPPVIESDSFTDNSKSRRREKRRKGRKWALGGPGMQAIFLCSGPISSGTGVFLPRGGGPYHKSTKNNPAVSPVLLPSHIVQALNLNVHELGQQIINPRLPDETKNCMNKTEENLEKTPNSDNVCLSPEINLPEEWTY
ncbi:uncharacterized protein [Primulina huaijiensis]|uniref:uncharacterized protein isoform X1 n=1 Tax=Primulina huaijiensis TaxID=1492673 RepID=UPI003CC7295E